MGDAAGPRLLTHTPFLLYFVGRGFSRFAAQMATVALGWQVYDKTGSALLLVMHQIALFVIFIYCLSYIDQWYLNIFCFLQDRRLAHRLNLAVNVLVSVVLFVLVNKATSIVVGELSQAHAK